MKNTLSEIKEATYENIVVECPNCKFESILNRISDLKDIMPIAGKRIKCENCKIDFHITGDLVPPVKYKWFWYDLHILGQNKKYGIYILVLCQTCELFMHQAIINKMIDKNANYRNEEGHFSYKEEKGVNGYMQIYDEFSNKSVSRITNCEILDSTKYKECTFQKLRTLFLHVFRDERESELSTIKYLKEDKRCESFNILENTDINVLRNNIVHKYAYRPSYADIRKYDKLIDCIFWLGTYLDVKDSLYFLNKGIKNQ